MNAKARIVFLSRMLFSYVCAIWKWLIENSLPPGLNPTAKSNSGAAINLAHHYPPATHLAARWLGLPSLDSPIDWTVL